jgi:hypothetical protein
MYRSALTPSSTFSLVAGLRLLGPMNARRTARTLDTLPIQAKSSRQLLVFSVAVGLSPRRKQIMRGGAGFTTCKTLILATNLVAASK